MRFRQEKSNQPDISKYTDPATGVFDQQLYEYDLAQKPHGRYILLPGSAPAIPRSVLDNISYEDVEIAARSIKERMKAVSEAARAEGVHPFFFVSPEGRESLTTLVGAELADNMIEMFHEYGRPTVALTTRSSE